MRIKENAAILDPSDAFEKKNNTLNFSIRRCSEKCNFPLFFLILKLFQLFHVFMFFYVVLENKLVDWMHMSGNYDFFFSDLLISYYLLFLMIVVLA